MRSQVQTGLSQAARPRDLRTRLTGVLRVFIGRIPPAIGNPLADRLGDLAYHVARHSRRAAISNLRHAMGRVPKPVLKKAVRGVFRNVTRNYYDLFRAPDMSDEAIDRYVDFDEVGWQTVLKKYEQKEGVVLVTAHFGSFDMITQVIARRGLPVSILVTLIKPQWLSDFITEMRGARGARMIVIGQEEEGALNLSALKESIGLLRKGGVLGVLADRNINHTGTMIRWMGHDTLVASGLAKMALRTRSAVVVGMCRRLPKGRYDVTFSEPVEPIGSANNEEDVRNMLTRVFAIMESYIKNNPEQWVLLQPVWP